MLEKIDEFFKLQPEIFNYFGEGLEWKEYPLADFRDCYWFYDSNESDLVLFSERQHNLINAVKAEIEGDPDIEYDANDFFDSYVEDSFFKEEFSLLQVDDGRGAGLQLSIILNNSKRIYGKNK